MTSTAGKDPRRNQRKRWIREPVLWEDMAGNAHFSAPDFCKAIGIEASQENVELVMREAPVIMQRMCPGMEVRRRWTEAD